MAFAITLIGCRIRLHCAQAVHELHQLCTLPAIPKVRARGRWKRRWTCAGGSPDLIERQMLVWNNAFLLRERHGSLIPFLSHRPAAHRCKVVPQKACDPVQTALDTLYGKIERSNARDFFRG